MDDIKLGDRVKEFRQMKGISLREMASKANVSASMLSQIENDMVNPSINTLKNIAIVLGIPLYKFFQEEGVSDQLIVRKGHYKMMGRQGEEAHYDILTPDMRGMIEFCLMRIPAGKASADTAYGHEGEEVAYVIQGETDISLDGTEFHLDEGDAIKIPPKTQHRWMNRSEQEVRVVFAVTPPSF